jgi:8-amino-7-oxononanoate synthase
MQSALTARDAEGLLRHEVVLDSPCAPRVRVDGRELVCFCSNDYLSLAGDARVRGAAIEGIGRWGVGAGASRLVSGTTRAHRELENTLARFKRTESAIVTPTGWMANHVVAHALVGRGDLVLCDKLNHASIIDAARSCGARLRTYAHCDMARLERLLTAHRSEYKRCLIVTDSLFSMDGDFAPLRALVDLRDRYDAMLLIDEAHATGVIGAEGRGVSEWAGVEDRVDVTVGTLSKALGSLGGFVAGRQVLIDTIRNSGRAYIFTTAPPGALCEAALASLEIVRQEPQRRRRVLGLADRLRTRLREAGLDTGDSVSQILPVRVGDASRTVALGRALLEEGFFVPAIRPPTVPRGTSRLRVSLSAGHEEGDVEDFAAALIRRMVDLDSGD